MGTVLQCGSGSLPVFPEILVSIFQCRQQPGGQGKSGAVWSKKVWTHTPSLPLNNFRAFSMFTVGGAGRHGVACFLVSREGGSILIRNGGNRAEGKEEDRGK